MVSPVPSFAIKMGRMRYLKGKKTINTSFDGCENVK